MYDPRRDESRKRVLANVAGILVARHLKTTDDLFRLQVKSADVVPGAFCDSVGRVDHAEAREVMLLDVRASWYR